MTETSAQREVVGGWKWALVAYAGWMLTRIVFGIVFTPNVARFAMYVLKGIGSDLLGVVIAGLLLELGLWIVVRRYVSWLVAAQATVVSFSIGSAISSLGWLVYYEAFESQARRPLPTETLLVLAPFVLAFWITTSLLVQDSEGQPLGYLSGFKVLLAQFGLPMCLCSCVFFVSGLLLVGTPR